MTALSEDLAAGEAAFRGLRARRAVEHINIATDGHRLAESGFWVVVATFEGTLDAWRLADVERLPERAERASRRRRWNGPAVGEWSTSLDRRQYCDGVDAIRGHIRDGEVYQVNLCRVLSAPSPAHAPGPDAVALSHVLSRGNPARFASRIVVPGSETMPGTWVVSASPELYVRIDGSRISSSPIKGTAAPGESMLPKDEAENVMITDLVRNDLSHVARPGTVAVPELLGLHTHPGLTHLQSTVSADLAAGFSWTPHMWAQLFAATFPPGSVSGAPKRAALDIIAALETAPRGPYCGAIGWIDADRRRAELAVGIRTFWWDDSDGGTLRFGTGAGITWGSEPEAEWRETELKARRLIALASTDTMAP